MCRSVSAVPRGRDKRSADSPETRDDLVERPDLHVAESVSEKLEAARFVSPEGGGCAGDEHAARVETAELADVRLCAQLVERLLEAVAVAEHLHDAAAEILVDGERAARSIRPTTDRSDWCLDLDEGDIVGEF